MKTTLEEFDLNSRDIKFLDGIEQNHYGDELVFEEEEEKERYKIWRNHRENVQQGEAAWEIEYCGSENKYKWETVGKGYRL
jgi:hypothetical protein